MCYVLAHSTVYKKVFDLNISWNEFCYLLNSRNETWYTDQKYLYQKINEHLTDIDILFLKRGWNGPADRRIDRIDWKYDIQLVKDGYYIDSHLLRPYKQYEQEIKKLTDLIL